MSFLDQRRLLESMPFFSLGRADRHAEFGCIAEPGLPTVDDLQVAAAAAAVDELQYGSLEGASDMDQGQTNGRSAASPCTTDSSGAESSGDESDASSGVSSSDVSRSLGAVGVDSPSQAVVSKSLGFDGPCPDAGTRDKAVCTAGGRPKSGQPVCLFLDGAEKEIADLLSCLMDQVAGGAQGADAQVQGAPLQEGDSAGKMESKGFRSTMAIDGEIMKVLSHMVARVSGETPDVHNGQRAADLFGPFSQQQCTVPKPDALTGERAQ